MFWLGIGCFAHKTFHMRLVLGACLESVWRFEWKIFYSSSLGVKLISACQEVLIWVWLPMNYIECFSFKPPHTGSKYAPKTYWTWNVLYAKKTNSRPKLRLHHRMTAMSSKNLEAFWISCLVLMAAGFLWSFTLCTCRRTTGKLWSPSSLSMVVTTLSWPRFDLNLSSKQNSLHLISQ